MVFVFIFFARVFNPKKINTKKNQKNLYEILSKRRSIVYS